MKTSDLKYFLAYIVPLTVYFSITLGGYWSFFTVLFVFGFIPLLEMILPVDRSNHKSSEEVERSGIRIFDILLYLNVPIVYSLLIYSVIYLSGQDIVWYEYIGYWTALGILCGSSGINVAHELGHRRNGFERFLSKMLLLPSHYMHFIIEHNLGHHKHVATPKDPATARRNEMLFTFWVRSTINSYLSAWKIENKRLERSGQTIFSAHNRMIQFTIIQSLYILTMFMLVPFHLALLVVLSGVFSFLLLETINYIEHYGIVRKRLDSGRYEPVQPHHSWNADYPVGRILLYELTRHSDHHYKADRKYQILRSIKNSPDLPWGYPGSMLMSLIPPLWFRKVNPLLDQYHSKL